MAPAMTSGGGTIAILAALREELSPIGRSLEGRSEGPPPAGAVAAGRIAGRPVALWRTGVGPSAARQAADAVLRFSSPAAILSVGFAGGLGEGLRLGDLVLADEIYEPGADGAAPRQWPADPELLAAARGAAGMGRVAVGRIATSRTVLATAAEKRAFAGRHGALAVDMESSGVARAANVHDARVLYLRAVVDEAGYDLPLDTTRFLMPDGRLRPLLLLGSLLRRPAGIRGLAELRNRAVRAGEALARGVAALLSALPLT